MSLLENKDIITGTKWSTLNTYSTTFLRLFYFLIVIQASLILWSAKLTGKCLAHLLSLNALYRCFPYMKIQFSQNAGIFYCIYFQYGKKKLIGFLHYSIQYFPSESIFVNKHQERNRNRNRFLLNFLSIHLIIKYTIYIQHCDRYSTLFVVKTLSVPEFDTNCWKQ